MHKILLPLALIVAMATPALAAPKPVPVYRFGACIGTGIPFPASEVGKPTVGALFTLPLPAHQGQVFRIAKVTGPMPTQGKPATVETAQGKAPVEVFDAPQCLVTLEAVPVAVMGVDL